METISNIAGAASKAIWGEGNNEEPVAGQQGAGTKTDPYDKGNEENKTGTVPDTTTSSSVQDTTISSSGPEINKAPTNGVDTTKNRDGPTEAQSRDVIGDPKSGQQPEQKQQGADKPADVPKDDKGKPKMPHTDSQREALVNSGEFPHDPNDHSGEPLKMHADSGKKDEEAAEQSKDDPRTDVKKDRSASVSQEGGDPHGEKKGTGEKIVKASGLEADGGDFDAANPGAGSEATRLAEQKGIKKDHKPPGEVADPASSKDRTTSPNGSEKAKVSKMQKLKEKLHMGTGKNLHA